MKGTRLRGLTTEIANHVNTNHQFCE